MGTIHLLLLFSQPCCRTLSFLPCPGVLKMRPLTVLRGDAAAHCVLQGDKGAPRCCCPGLEFVCVMLSMKLMDLGFWRRVGWLGPGGV